MAIRKASISVMSHLEQQHTNSKQISQFSRFSLRQQQQQKHICNCLLKFSFVVAFTVLSSRSPQRAIIPAIRITESFCESTDSGVSKRSVSLNTNVTELVFTIIWITTQGCTLIPVIKFIIRSNISDVMFTTEPSKFVLNKTKHLAVKRCTGAWFVLPKPCDLWRPKIRFHTEPRDCFVFWIK